jgi:Transposase DDE domain
LPSETYETSLFLGAVARFEVRVVFRRCPPSVVAQRRCKAIANAKRKGKQWSEKHLALLECSILITNVPQTMLNLIQVLQLYGLRWQIELIFKLCKSQLCIDQGQGCGESRILCQLYARLILFVLLYDLVAAFRLSAAGELSVVKAFHLFADAADGLVAGFKGTNTALAGLLLNLKDDFLHFAQKTKRKKSPSTLALFVYDFP